MNTNNSTASNIDIRSVFESIKNLQNSMSGFPTAIITTDETFADLKRAMQAAYDGNTTKGAEFTVYGIKVETYPTIRECLDRMQSPLPRDRLQLVLKEGIPVDCFNHPWIRNFITSISPKESCIENG